MWGRGRDVFEDPAVLVNPANLNFGVESWRKFVEMHPVSEKSPSDFLQNGISYAPHRCG